MLEKGWILRCAL
ncbi:hypothetical protein LINPERPRIM_LOCUS243 [Linum perenne]